MKPKQEDSTRRLFWTIYVFDKKISFLLGRSSHMQDSEIDAEPPAASTDSNLQLWDELFLIGITLARIQGEIYTTLCSATGMKNSASERSADIRRLHVDLLQLRMDFFKVSSTSSAIMKCQNRN